MASAWIVLHGSLCAEYTTTPAGDAEQSRNRCRIPGTRYVAPLVVGRSPGCAPGPLGVSHGTNQLRVDPGARRGRCQPGSAPGRVYWLEEAVQCRRQS